MCNWWGAKHVLLTAQLPARIVVHNIHMQGSTLSTCSTGVTKPLTMRTTSDVSYNADLDGGVLVYWSAIPSQAGFYIVGGTSAGSPQ